MEVKVMVPTQAMVQKAIKKSVRPDGMVSVVEVQRSFAADVVIPRRFNDVIEMEIRDMYPDASYQGGGFFQLPAQMEEQEEAQEEQSSEPEFYEAPLLSWTSQSGQEIKVFFFPEHHVFSVLVDGKEYEQCVIRRVPAQHAAKARANGIVAMLGPVALNKERKAICEAEDNKYGSLGYLKSERM